MFFVVTLPKIFNVSDSNYMYTFLFSLSSLFVITVRVEKGAKFDVHWALLCLAFSSSIKEYKVFELGRSVTKA